MGRASRKGEVKKLSVSRLAARFRQPLSNGRSIVKHGAGIVRPFGYKNDLALRPLSAGTYRRRRRQVGASVVNNDIPEDHPIHNVWADDARLDIARLRNPVFEGIIEMARDGDK